MESQPENSESKLYLTNQELVEKVGENWNTFFNSCFTPAHDLAMKRIHYFT